MCGESFHQDPSSNNRQCSNCFRVQDHLGDWRFDHLLVIMKHQAKLGLQEQFEAALAEAELKRKNMEAAIWDGDQKRKGLSNDT